MGVGKRRIHDPGWGFIQEYQTRRKSKTIIISMGRCGAIHVIAWVAAGLLGSACNKPGTPSGGSVVTPLPPPGIAYWLTTGDRSNLLSRQTTALDFGTISNSLPVITVDSTQVFQPIDGFGYTLT